LKFDVYNNVNLSKGVYRISPNIKSESKIKFYIGLYNYNVLICAAKHLFIFDWNEFGWIFVVNNAEPRILYML